MVQENIGEDALRRELEGDDIKQRGPWIWCCTGSCDLQDLIENELDLGAAKSTTSSPP